MFANILSRFWWLLAIRGVLWILFGVYVLAEPGLSVLLLASLCGAFVLLDGALNLAHAIAGRREHENWWLLLFIGVTGMAVGVLMLRAPTTTALVLVFCLAAWSIVTGLFEIVGAITLREEIDGELWLTLAGLIAVTFGVLLIARPVIGPLALLWMTAAYAIVSGGTFLALALRARGFVRQAIRPRSV